MNNVITYLGHYDLLRNGVQERTYSLAGARKMDFVCDELRELGYDVNIVSTAYSSLKGHGRVPEEKKIVRDGITLILTPSNRAATRAAHARRVLSARLWLFKYLIKNCGPDDYVMVYHNYADALVIVCAQKIKKFRLVLQIEEQYSMVWKLTPFQKWKEGILLKYGKEGSLVVSELLANRLKILNPIISYGSYKQYKGIIPPKNENKIITLVFTGMIETVRNGAFYSIESMKYLPDNYRLLLSGPVSKEDKKKFEEVMAAVNVSCGRTACTYMGVLNNKEYEKMLLTADIALNPQKEGGFGEYVFPSKILTYMSYNLPVVSTKGKSIVKSQLAKYITFADDFTPKAVADAIQRVDKNHIDYRKKLYELEKEFQGKLKDRFVL